MRDLADEYKPSLDDPEATMTTKAKKKYVYTPESIRDELTDRIEQGWSNDRIVEYYGDETGPRLRQWLTNRRRKLARFWDSFG